MVDLIRALIQVKTPLTLFAFLSLVFLAAFRTKRVPELFFGLAKDKLTKERFGQLLHRFMVFGFGGFVLVCAVAVVGQVLAYKAQARPVPLDDVRSELKNLHATEDQTQAALKAYAEGLAHFQQHDVAQAIQSLQQSIDAVPTIAAQTTLALLYRAQGDQENAKKYAAAAAAQANLQGNSLAQVRLQQLSESSSGGGGTGMVGDKKPLPEGGKSFEEAVPISPGLFATVHTIEAGIQYYSMRLKAGQTLRIDFRSPNEGENGLTCAAIYDANGGHLTGDSTAYQSDLKTIQWTTPVDGLVYLSIGNSVGAVTPANAVYRISVQ